jgi:2-succinyl-5-enolpyruvyl-6-hydroxy-3-cyclohexene-1-carboxylate synthase
VYRGRHGGRLSGEHRRPRPALRELFDRHVLDLVGEAVVGGSPRIPLDWTRDPRAGADQDQAIDPRYERRRERRVQSQPSAHRVPDEREPGRPELGQVAEHRLERHRLSLARGPVATNVGRERTVAFPERCDHGVPASPGVGEAVEEDDIARHRLRIMTATDTYLLLRAFCDELARCGMEHACTAPGSRCTPIVLSLVREERIRCWSHIDERCAGFFALGAGKRSGRPIAVTCTSGTAAANLAPAVIEARHARVPLIVLTADRPPELREVGAGQTIDQLKLYGDAVKWFFEVGVDQATPAALRFIRTLACRAYWTAVAGPPGPVHLNFPLHEPLVLDRPLPLPDDDTGRAGARPHVTFDSGGGGVPAGGALPAGRIVIVAGSDRDPAAAIELARFAARKQIPLLADPLSGARRGEAAVAHYDLLLRDQEFAAAHQPQFVIRTGDLPTSKPLRAWLAGLETAQIAFDPDGAWQDPDGVVGMRIRAPYRALLGDQELDTDGEWFASWRAADDAIAGSIERTLGDELSEPLVARSLGEWLPQEATLFVASSMPIRDVEEFVAASEDGPRVLSNRGANGIDGTVSSAYGARAAADDGPVVLLIGDVALAHDIGGLLAASRLGLGLTIVLLNNDGGGIFHFLAVAGETDAFEEHVATPHGLDFAHAAALYDCRFERANTVADLRAAVEASIAGDDTTIIEVRTNREENLALHRRVADAALAALAGTDGAGGAAT